MEWHDKACRRLDLADFGDGTSCLSCGSVRPAHPILPAIKQTSEIRIIRVFSGTFDDDVECEIETEDLSKDIEYEAISYTWADETGDASHCRTIILSAQPFKVTRNCEMALKRVRRQYSTRRIWIDAICINQDDVSERGHQVGLMPRIYSGAKTVLMYIGEATSFSAVAQKNLVKMLLPGILPLNDAYWIAIKSKRYFTRVWILQEVALARKATLIHGEQSMPWGAICQIAKSSAGSGSLPSVFRLDCTALSTPDLLMDLLVLAKSANASDPRDKAFALLGLLPSRRIGTLEANYRLTVDEVYMQVALHLASTMGWLPVLFYAGKAAQDSGLSSPPSWLPDWSAPMLPGMDTVPMDYWIRANRACPLDVTYHEAKQSISLRLFQTPNFENEWHVPGEYGIQSIAQHICFPVIPGTVKKNRGQIFPEPSLFAQRKPREIRDGISTSSLAGRIEDLYILRHSHDLVAAPIGRLSLRSLELSMDEIVTSRYTLTRLHHRQDSCTEFNNIPIAVAVQIFTITSNDWKDKRKEVSWTGESMEACWPGWLGWVLYELETAFPFNPRLYTAYTDLIRYRTSLLRHLKEWAENIEPVAEELEQLWMNTFLAGDLVHFKPDHREYSAYTAWPSVMEPHDTKLRISINDALWRLLVRCLITREKTIEIV